MKKKPRGKRKGAPSKYDDKDYPGTVDGVTESMTHKQFFEWCSVEHIAQALGIHRDTLNLWRSKHAEFEDSMERWELKRNTLFYLFCRVLQPGVWIFLAKNWLGMRDQQFITAKSTETIKFVSKFPILGGKKSKVKEEEYKSPEEEKSFEIPPKESSEDNPN